MIKTKDTMENKMKIAIYLSFLMLLFISSCKKFSVSQPDFNVSVPSVTVKVGDTVNFSFSGSADIVTFYPGIIGFNYAAINKTDTIFGTSQLQFKTYFSNPPLPAGDSIRLMITNNLSSIDTPGINKATWTDITNRAVFSTGKDSTPSGIVDLTDFANQGIPVNVAFKYSTVPTGKKEPYFKVESFNINNLLPDSSIYQVANINNSSWSKFSFIDSTQSWDLQIYASGGYFYFNGTGYPVTSPAELEWIITMPIQLNASPPSFGIPLKYLGGPTVTGTSYVYKRPGRYQATFVAINNSGTAQTEVIRTINIVVK